MMAVEVLNENSRFDPTPEQLAANAEEHWRVTLVAMEVEQRGVADRVAQLTISLDGINQREPVDRHDEAVIARERASIADDLDHKIARLAHIADVIAAHRKAKP